MLSAFRTSFALLFTARFGTYWVASLLSNIGTWTQQIAEPWLLLDLGASSLIIGLDAFMGAAPLFALTPLGGALADRCDRRWIIAIFQSIQMLCPLLLVILLLTGEVQLWIIIACSLVVGITDALSMPSFQTIVPLIVDKRQIATGLALSSTQFNLSRMLGPAIAGLLITLVGAVGCFAVNAASYLPFIGIALWILPPDTTRREVARKQHGPLFEGFKPIAADASLRLGILMALTTSVLCAPLVTFAPVLVKGALDGSAAGYSGAVTAYGVGGLVGAMALLGVDASRDRRWLGAGFSVAAGLVTAVAAMSPSLVTLFIAMVCSGITMNICSTSINAFLQSNAPSQLRGQTISLFMLATRGGVAIGGLIAGLTVTLVGIRYALLANGLFAAVACAVLGRFWLALPAPVGSKDTVLPI